MNTQELYKCINCGRGFPRAQQLRMHVIRMHTGQYKTPPSQTPEQKLIKKRRDNKKRREAFVKLGLTTAGKPRKLPIGVRGGNVGRWKGHVPKTKRQFYLEQRERNYAKGLNAKGVPYKNTALSAIMRKSWATRRLTSKGKPAAARLTDNGLNNIRMAQQARRRREKAAKRRLHVWPLPTDLPRGEEQAQPQLPKVKVFNFCPHCGEKLNQPTE